MGSTSMTPNRTNDKSILRHVKLGFDFANTVVFYMIMIVTVLLLQHDSTVTQNLELL